LNSLKRNFNSAGKPKSGGAQQVKIKIAYEKANWQTNHAVYISRSGIVELYLSPTVAIGKSMDSAPARFH
jgi:hypothetical protein